MGGAQLAAALVATRFRCVEVLNNEVSCYLPFEMMLGHLLSEQLRRRSRVVCFSSACLSLHYLYGLPCLVGFGEERVRRYFAPAHVDTRLQVEGDLRRVLWGLNPVEGRRAA